MPPEISCKLPRPSADVRMWRLNDRLSSYRSIEIGVVHYCDREDRLAPRRKAKHGEAEDTSIARLQLLTRTVRANPWLASQVRYLKLPRMARQGAAAELARIVSVLPNLGYVDVPDGLFEDQPSCMTLKNELTARCPEIQRMTYKAGAEGSFSLLAVARSWSNLKVLDLDGVAVDSSQVVSATASLIALQDLTLNHLPRVDDALFLSDFGGLRLPPVHHLKLHDMHHISSPALAAYLQRSDVTETVTQLSLIDVSIPVSELHLLLRAAPLLKAVRISSTVSKPLLITQLPPLVSRSLQQLTFEIVDQDALRNLAQPPAWSHYSYLCSSITSGQLPALRSLYALSGDIPTLLMPPPTALFASGGPSATAPRIVRELRVYTKAIAENDWDLTIISPPSAHDGRGSRTNTRPVSLYDDPQINTAYAHRPKDSIMVSNGWGGFLAVPSHERRSSTSSRSKYDLDWMGT